MNALTLDANDLAAQIKNGSVSAEDYVTKILDRIKKVENSIHSYISLNDRAVDEARRIDKMVKNDERMGRLAGVPIAVKDNICTKGLRTTCASKMLEDYVPPYNATVIDKLRQEGAIILGKTNLDEFAMGSTTEFSSFGPTRNPWDVNRVPGGSSGGSAASLAAAEATLALGSDTGGSIRCPASFCSVVGLKPTYGLVSRFGLVSFANSLELIGPMGRSASDVALMLSCIAGRDSMDHTTLDVDSMDYTAKIKQGIKGVKIGIVKEMISDGVDDAVAKSVHDAANKLESLGASIEEISINSLQYALASYYTIAMAEVSSNLARYDGVRYGLHMNPEGFAWNAYYTKARSNFGSEVKRRIMIGTYVLSSGYYGKYYLKAQQIRTLMRQELAGIFKKLDLLIAPTMPVMPFKIGEKIDEPLKMYMADIDTVVANLTGVPAISVPCAFKDNLPIGLQIMGNHLSEELLLRTAYAFEQVNDVKKVVDV
ncbi:MAG: aspartyl-tRNA(Asn)/glutamyl-tRNA(Gln) amidotransferase subunit A [Candidatus Nitrosomirales archaeon]|jgi:aspartyl-tRNA(Asn)/glutamyl-tRNA(Gln) amidotransferase subunit A